MDIGKTLIRSENDVEGLTLLAASVQATLLSDIETPVHLLASRIRTVFLAADLLDDGLLREFNLEIGAGLGAFAGKVWRIGLMGYAARRENVQLCVSGIADCLNN